MPLHLVRPPANAYQLIAQTISQLSMASGSAERITNVNDPSKLSTVLPHMVYTLGSSDIAQSKNLNQARLVAWRFLILYGALILGAIEFSCDAQGGNLRFSSFDTGGFALGTQNAVMTAEALPSVKTGSYELRVFKAPSVYVMALWLKNLQSGDDIVIPIAPAGLGLQAASEGGASLPQPPQEFIHGLLPAAITALRSDTASPSGGR